MNNHLIQTIGILHSPFKQKFGIPRQPRLIPNLVSTIIMKPEFSSIECFKGIEIYTHLWVLFLFHENLESGWKPTVRPPRLGGKKKMGVFATRSTFRPNGIGQSAVKLKKVYQKDGLVYVDIEGADLLDGTPIIDIKPYITYSDSIQNAECGFAQEPPPNTLAVIFTDSAIATLEVTHEQYPQLKELITQVLAADPRPAYRQLDTDPNRYGVQLYHYNIKWQVQNGEVSVLDIEDLDARK